MKRIVFRAAHTRDIFDKFHIAITPALFFTVLKEWMKFEYTIELRWIFWQIGIGIRKKK